MAKAAQNSSAQNTAAITKPSLADIEAKIRTYKGGHWPADLGRRLDSVDPADISQLLAFIDQNCPLSVHERHSIAGEHGFWDASCANFRELN